jgi:hypothetical protein
MDPLAPNAVASDHTKGESLSTFMAAGRECPAKQNAYTRDDRLARGGTRPATAVSFQAPGLPASASDLFCALVAITTAAASPPLAATAASAAATNNAGSDDAGSDMS